MIIVVDITLVTPLGIVATPALAITMADIGEAGGEVGMITTMTTTMVGTEDMEDMVGMEDTKGTVDITNSNSIDPRVGLLTCVGSD